MDQIKIGKFIAECRKKNNITQMQLAEKALAVSVNTTSYRKGAEEIINTTNETISHEVCVK